MTAKSRAVRDLGAARLTTPRPSPGSCSEYVDDDAVTAVLRSWEERFGAVLAASAPGVFELVVGAPPHGFEQAGLLAAEHGALAGGFSDIDRSALRRSLRSDRMIPGYSWSRHWVLAWAD